MHDVAFDVDHDVSIVAVFHLEDVAHQGVGSQRPAEVILRFT